MKFLAYLSALLLFTLARAEPLVQVTVEWLNHAERQCKGCGTQIVTLESGSWFLVGEECRDGMVYLKIAPKMTAAGIEVSLVRQVRRGEKDFIDDAPAKSVVVKKDEKKEIELRGFRYAVSAGISSTIPPPKPTQG